MAANCAALRIVEKRNPYFSVGPKIVVFQVDPGSLAFEEVSGDPEGLLGFPRAAWLEPGFWPARVHSDDRAAVLDICLGRARAGRDHELEYRLVDARGRTVWVHEIVEAARGDGPEIRGFVMDVTERVALESDVRMALALKDELFRVVAEEISQPVRTISAFGDMLERHLAVQGDDVGSDYAVAIRDGVQRLDRVLAGLTRAALTRELSFEELLDSLAALSARAPRD